MDLPRRDLPALLAAAAAAMAQSPDPVLPSGMHKFEELTLKGRTRPVLRGKTHKDVLIQVHQTELPPGQAPHPAHHHPHEEMTFIREGTLEVTIAGKTKTVGPGSVIYVASNEEHGWKNSGTVTAHYFVLALSPGQG